MTAQQLRAVAATATAAALLLAACSSDSPGSDDAGAGTSTSAAPQPPPPAPEREPEFTVTFTSTCQDDFPQVFVTGDMTDNTETGYRFIADATVYNDGTIPARAFITVTWFLVGGERITLEKIVRNLKPGRRQRVGFTKPATFDQVSRMAANRQGDKLCAARVNALPIGQGLSRTSPARTPARTAAAPARSRR